MQSPGVLRDLFHPLDQVPAVLRSGVVFRPEFHLFDDQTILNGVKRDGAGCLGSVGDEDITDNLGSIGNDPIDRETPGTVGWIFHSDRHLPRMRSLDCGHSRM
jgi:hypothetical protein